MERERGGFDLEISAYVMVITFAGKERCREWCLTSLQMELSLTKNLMIQLVRNPT